VKNNFVFIFLKLLKFVSAFGAEILSMTYYIKAKMDDEVLNILTRIVPYLLAYKSRHFRLFSPNI
jgi:hypothetical protein